MSLSGALVLAAATASAPAQEPASARGVELAEARVTAQILAAAIVRQSSGPEPAGEHAARPQLSRRGQTLLVEYE